MLLSRRETQDKLLTQASYPDLQRDEKQESRRGCEDIAEGEPLRDQPRLHCRRTDLPPNPQRHVWPDEVVVRAPGDRNQVLQNPAASCSMGGTYGQARNSQ